jgi:LAS superfamily LD-carboxypeptidase LdcB
MRPDVARAFDRMEAAPRVDGVRLIVTSGYRSDAEQAELYARRPEVGCSAGQVAPPMGHRARRK